jgi:hypothetical protein
LVAEGMPEGLEKEVSTFDYIANYKNIVKKKASL